MAFIILIPAYNPDEKLLHLIDDLNKIGSTSVVILNDGSRSECGSVFDEVKTKKNCHLIVHAVNQGKGRALKTGINHILATWPNVEGVITADADGQHTAVDIYKVITTMASNPLALTLGCRDFGDSVPFRSRFGNGITRWVFRLLVGVRVSDTQTGLRGIPRAFLPACITMEGERYEYEINMLVKSVQEKLAIVEVPIQTIYLDDNSSSHFSPIFDSFKIYFVLLRFLLASLSGSIIDYLVFLGVLAVFGGNVAMSLISARVVAGVYNYLVNKRLVFKEKGNAVPTFVKYCTLAAGLITFSYFGISWFSTSTIIPVGIAKILVEVAMFPVSFAIQRDWVFAKRQNE